MLTHGHPDHVGGIGMFNVPIYVHLEDDRMIEKRKKGTRTPSGFDMPFDYMTFHRKLVEEGTVIPFGNSEIKVVHTPGHSEGGVCYVFDKDIFVGDTLFSGGVGRWDFSTGDYEKLKQSVMRIIDTFPQDYAIHSGHGDSTTVGRERSSNPYYLKWKNL